MIETHARTPSADRAARPGTTAIVAAAATGTGADTGAGGADQPAADARERAARRVRPLSCEQRPALLPPRPPGGSGQEVDRRYERNPVQDVEGRHAHSTRSLRQPERRQDPVGDDAAQV